VEERMDPDALYNTLKTILNACKGHQYSWPFLVPVDRKVSFVSFLF
jgi:hypothetical protein